MNRSILTDGKFESHAQAKVSAVCQPEPGLPLAQEHVPRKESLQAEVECGDGCANCRKLEQEIRALKEECNHWQAKAKYCKKQLHGRKSEKSEPQSEPCKAPIKRSVSSQKRGAQPGCKGHGRTPREPLPRVEQVLDAAPQDRVCPSCGLPCQAVSGTDDCEVLESVVQAVVRRFRRARHARSCQCPESPPMITAAPPERVIPKGLLGVSVWTQILLQKYLHSRSTGNLLTEMGHQGMPLSPGTVCDGLKRLSVLFQPLFEELLKHQMGEQAFHCDETGWKVHEPVAGKASNRWWLWVFHSPSSTIYRPNP